MNIQITVGKKQSKILHNARKIWFCCLVLVLILPLISPNVLQEASAEKVQSENIQDDGYLDKIIFGNPDSESVHNYTGESTRVVSGFLGESARVSEPLDPVEWQSGDLTFNMKVDPYLRNYLSVKFAGAEASSGNSIIEINGERVGFISHGDYQAINKGWTLRDRFFYVTTMLPLESTYGKDVVEITIKTQSTSNITTSSRGYYNAYTHNQAYFSVEGETQGEKLSKIPSEILAADISEADKEAIINQYTTDQINKFNDLSAKIDNSPTAKVSIVKYVDELRFYSMALLADWTPAQTPQQKKAALERIFKVIDNHTKDYYGNTKNVLRGGHQGDWGGYYGALGEALYIVENLIKDDEIYGQQAFDEFLDEPFVTGTIEGVTSLAGVDWNGGELTRREAWERVLKANFDFSRSRLSYIYNQVLYTYEGAWKSHEGLRMVGSSFYEGKERSHQILLETAGARPFLGEEVLVGPNGEELDLYHSLFYHDTTAVFTDDVIQIVGKGLAKSKLDVNGEVVRRKPYGEHYTGITEAGLTRENTYVANYGEAANYLAEYFYRTLNHEGDEALNDELLKISLQSIHARGYTRYTELDDNGKRIMRAEQVVDERNESLTGFYSYATRVGAGTALLFASLEKQMSDNALRYESPDWEKYWSYASEAAGYAQQQIQDNQLFNNFSSIKNTIDYRVADTYKYLTETRADYDRFNNQLMAGVVHPQTDFDYYTQSEIETLGVNPEDYEQFAWADIDNMFLSIRDGDSRIFGSLFYRNRGLTATGRLHVMNGDYENIVQIATDNIFQYSDYSLRSDIINIDFQSDRINNVTGAPNALAGELAPIAYQPGVGKVSRDNYEADSPYSGYSDLLTARYGKYFMIFNTTREEYGNKQTFEVDLPEGQSGSAILDLVSGSNISVINGKITIPAKTAMVLKLASDLEIAPKPSHVDFVNTILGNGYVALSWKMTSGGQTYTVKRSTSENGSYEAIATNVQGTFYKDTNVQNGNKYYYKVAAVNNSGAGLDSWRVEADLSAYSSESNQSVWREDHIGTSTGDSIINNSSIVITDANGTGFGEGEDYNIYKRDINDSMHYVSQAVYGSFSISAKIESAAGNASGIMLRDQLTADTRYYYFGADSSGNLVLQNRTRNSIHQWSGEVVSPYNAHLQGYKVADYPYLKLVRDFNSHYINAFISIDGVNWEFVNKLFSPFPSALHAGVTSSREAQFSNISIEELPFAAPQAYVIQVKDQITLNWNKPKQAASFYVYRSMNQEASITDPVFKPGTYDLEEGSLWTEVIKDTNKTTYKDTLRYGTAYYKVLAVDGDGTQTFSSVVETQAESIVTLLTYLESLPAENYTKVSYYLFTEELNRVKDELTKPEYDEEQLIKDLYTAQESLISSETLNKKLDIQPTMVKASDKIWSSSGGTGTAEQNGWLAFDGDLTTGTDTLSSKGWIQVDLGEGHEKSIDSVRYSPRTCCVVRINGAQIQGSNDGQNWNTIFVINGINEAKWYKSEFGATDKYRYFRYNDTHGGNTNIAELEFYKIAKDDTLLSYFLNRAESELLDSVHTPESRTLLEQAVMNAKEVLSKVDTTDPEIEAATESLQLAINGLVLIEGMPKLDVIPDQNVIAGKSLQFKVKASGGVSEIVYGVRNLPEGAVFDAETQIFNWTPTLNQGGNFEVTFTAKSGNLSSSRTITIKVVGKPIVSPEESLAWIAKQENSYYIMATDTSGIPLTFKVATNLPAGAVLSSTTGQFKWKPTQADYGSHSIVFIVSNGSFEATHTLKIDVNLNVIAPEGYTQGSYYLFLKEIERIKGDMSLPNADKEALAAQIVQAEQQLVNIDSLSEQIPITTPMVIASHRSWDKKYDAATNGWFAFDGNLSTGTDAEANPSWIRVDMGENNNAIVGYVKFFPRAGNAARMNGAILQGSQDGTNYTNLYTFSGISKYEWQTVYIPNDTTYRYIRYYSPAGFANVMELQYLTKPLDTTLLDLLLEEAGKIDQQLYTKESVEVLQSAIDSANENSMGTQTQVNEAAYQLKIAIQGLTRALSISSLLPVEVITTVGVAPVLPSVVAAVYSDDSINSVEVDWETITPSQYANVGSFKVEGSVQGTDIKAEATVKVVGDSFNLPPVFDSIDPINITIGASVSFNVYAADPEGEKVHYLIENLPNHAEWDADAGTMNWLPETTGQFEIIIFAKDESGATSSLTVIVIVNDEEKATGVPGIPVLSSNNGYDTGLLDGDFEITMNMWWGNNASSYNLYEDGKLIESKSLRDDTPFAQRLSIPVSGKKNGTYVYTCELINRFGITQSSPLTVKVAHADPGTPILSHDNWDGDGEYKIAMNMWWGTNAKTYRLYENGQLIDTQTLAILTPNAQTANTSIKGKGAGIYEYIVELENDAGITKSSAMTVKVNK
ncbi:putative Ig domain-containing protein [Paenibacillus donghaensis]|uniref:Staphylococcus aureus surface protein A n=1 Tax=Paenibacillus donghaensis TaxID=414771 RepID=A0A2Z2KJL9_9BACL|nr:putative Ig domain-containing protein [Paenibacillus donghaensis]ASA23490.1 hypothetical protein B9T62_23415 [Paenibacillus donghaensis]